MSVGCGTNRRPGAGRWLAFPLLVATGCGDGHPPRGPDLGEEVSERSSDAGDDASVKAAPHGMDASAPVIADGGPDLEQRPDANAPEDVDDAGRNDEDSGTPVELWNGRVDAVLIPDEQCNFDVDSRVSLAAGSYDVAGLEAGADDACDRPYMVRARFIVGSAAPESEPAAPDSIEVHSVEVEVLTLQRTTVAFESPPLPNPFSVGATSVYTADGRGLGIAAAGVIPVAYAQQLGAFDNEQVLVNVTLRATASPGAEASFEPFLFPVSICEGCLSTCASVVPDIPALIGDDCADNAAADGRFCIEPGC